MNVSAARMAMETVLSIRPSLDRSPSACVMHPAACAALAVKAVRVPEVKVKAVSVVHPGHQKVAALLLAVRGVVPQVVRKAAAHLVARKVVVLALGGLVDRKEDVREWRGVACLVIPRSPSNAWTQTPMAVLAKKNLSLR